MDVVGVGDVCSFAQMDVRRHGHPGWQAEDRFHEGGGGVATAGTGDTAPLAKTNHYTRVSNRISAYCAMYFVFNFS